MVLVLIIHDFVARRRQDTSKILKLCRFQIQEVFQLSLVLVLIVHDLFATCATQPETNAFQDFRFHVCQFGKATLILILIAIKSKIVRKRHTKLPHQVRRKLVF